MPNGIAVGVNVHIDHAGRVVLPKALRERFQIRGGDTLELEVKGETIQLRPQNPRIRLERVNGVLVLRGPTAVPGHSDLVTEARAERIEELTREASERE